MGSKSVDRSLQVSTSFVVNEVNEKIEVENNDVGKSELLNYRPKSL